MNSDDGSALDEEEEEELPPLEMLPNEILSRAFSYLDNSKDLLSLSLCSSKHIRKAITTHLVVASSIFAGGISKERMEHIRTLVLNKSIHIPSTFRLLRLINAKRCERDDKCYGYNRTTQLACENDVTVVHPYRVRGIAYGMHICGNCAEALSIPEPCHSFRDLALSLKRIKTRSSSPTPYPEELIASQQTERITGERVGPVYDSQTHRQLIHTHDGCCSVTRSIVLEATNPICDSPSYEEQRAKILLSFDSAKMMYPRYVRAKQELFDKMKCREEELRVQREQTENLQQQHKVLTMIEKELVGFAYKDLILQHTSKNGQIEFLGPCQILLGELMEKPFPSSKNDETLLDAIKCTKHMYKLLYKYGFLYGTDSIQKMKAKPTSLAEELLYRFCIEDIRFFATMHTRESKIYDGVVKYLQFGKPTLFMVSLLSDQMLYEAAKMLAGKAAEGHEPQSPASDYAKAHFKLYWTGTVAEKLNAAQGSTHRRKEIFSEAIESIIEMYANYCDYLNHPEYLEWDPESEGLSSDWSKEEFSDIGTSYTMDMLMKRDFSGVLDHQKGLAAQFPEDMYDEVSDDE